MNKEQFLEDVIAALYDGTIGLEDIEEAYLNHELSNDDIDAISEAIDYIENQEAISEASIGSFLYGKINHSKYKNLGDGLKSKAIEHGYNKFKAGLADKIKSFVDSNTKKSLFDKARIARKIENAKNPQISSADHAANKAARGAKFAAQIQANKTHKAEIAKHLAAIKNLNQQHKQATAARFA